MLKVGMNLCGIQPPLSIACFKCYASFSVSDRSHRHQLLTYDLLFCSIIVSSVVTLLCKLYKNVIRKPEAYQLTAGLL